MEKLPFEFKNTLDKLNLEDYLYIYRTLDEDEYPIVEVGGKKVRNNYPLPKDKRTTEHIRTLKQKVVKHLTNLPVNKLNEDILIDWCINQIKETFLDIETKLDSKEIKYSTPNFKDWTFIRWILFEQRITKGFNIVKEDEVIESSPGINWILPMTYGEFTEDEVELNLRYNYFLRELPLRYSLKLYREQIMEIESIKKNHHFIYSGGGSNAGINTAQHFRIFGWVETLRSLVVNSKAFGNYKETKESNLFEVLEFLNINASYIKAENSDLKNRK